MKMNVNGSYKAVVYRGLTSAVVTGKVVAIVANSELGHYGFSGDRLYSENYHLLPQGTPYNPKGSLWYVLNGDGKTTGSYTIVNSDWIKPNGVTEAETAIVTIVGTFTSSDSPTILSELLYSAGIKTATVKAASGPDKWGVSDLKIGTKYTLGISDKDNSRVDGIYEGSVNPAILETIGINPTDQYSQYTWDVSHLSKLNSYKWNLFSPFDSLGSKFAMASELIGSISEYRDQDTYAISVEGVVGDIAMIRSVLSTIKCTEITLGTNV